MNPLHDCDWVPVYGTTTDRFLGIRHRNSQINVIDFQKDKIWINNQPANELKGFNFKIIKQERYAFDIKEDNFYLTLENIDEISLTCMHHDRELNCIKVSPWLTADGLQQMLSLEFQRDVDQLHTAESYALKGSFTLKENQIEANARIFIKFRDEIYAHKSNQTSASSSLEASLAKISFVNFREEANLLIDPRAPVWRTIEKGLNFEGKCQNKDCASNKKEDDKVCIPMGMGVCRVSEERNVSKCPLQDCNNTVNVTNCIFWSCSYNVAGTKSNGERINISKTAASDKVISFLEGDLNDPQGNIEEWVNLIITTEPLSSFRIRCAIL